MIVSAADTFASIDPTAFEMGVEQIQALIHALDERLRARGVAATIEIYGGAAIALSYGRDTTTPDIDGVADHVAVYEEAASLADDLGIPTRWLNSNVQAFRRPRREGAVETTGEPGLTVIPADARTLLAMKLVSFRRKDRPDIRILVAECGMGSASAQQFAAFLAEQYEGEDALADALGIPGVDGEAAQDEARLIGEEVRRMLDR